MVLVKQTFKLKENGIAFDCYIIAITERGGDTQFYFTATDSATCLGYKKPQNAIAYNVRNEWKKSWADLKDSFTLGALDVPKNWQPHTVFINEAGLYALIMRSKKPEAIKFQKWMFEEVLPSIRRTGKYDINKTSDSRSAQFNESYELTREDNERLQLQNKFLETQNKCLTLEKQLAENENKYRGIVHNYQLKIVELVNEGKLAAIGYGVFGVLAKKNIEKNDELLSKLAAVSDRVVPSIPDLPHKEQLITCYRTADDNFKVTRCQEGEQTYRDSVMKRMQKEKFDGQEGKRRKTEKNYGWLRDAEKCHQVKCPNPVTLWNRIKKSYPHFTFGIIFTNHIHTAIRFLKEEEIRDKYHRYRMIHEKVQQSPSSASKGEKRSAEEFTSLNFSDAQDAVNKCLTSTVESKEKFVSIIDKAIEQIQHECSGTQAPRRVTDIDCSQIANFVENNDIKSFEGFMKSLDCRQSISNN